MICCMSATEPNLDAQLDPRFGRCAYLLIVNTDTMQFSAIPNLGTDAIGGTGIHAAQMITNEGAKVVIAGNVGPNSFKALSAAGIDVITGASGTVREVVEKFNKGEYKKTIGPVVEGHFGVGEGKNHGL
jgi:predicted Fe-Mo cluster-binding NifX family protein